MKIILFVLGVSFLSCTDSHDFDINGHWHVEKNIGCNFRIHTMDFEEENGVTIDKGLSGLMGSFDSVSIVFGVDCLNLVFDYQVQHDRLILSERTYGVEKVSIIKLFRCSVCCDRQVEFFQNELIDIDLPVYSDKIDSEPYYSYLSVPILFGKPINGNFSNYKMVLNDEFGTVEDLNLFFENFKLKILEGRRNRIYCTIYTDKDTPIEMINPVILYCNKRKIDVYLIGRKKDYSEGLKLLYKRP